MIEWLKNFDNLQVLFWGIAYVLIIIFTLINKTTYIPYTALIFNFSWETNTIIMNIKRNYFFWGHVIWFVLDSFVLIMAFVFSGKKQKVYLSLGSVLCITIFYYIFEKGQMLISSFVIDLIMAVLFIFNAFYNKDKIKYKKGYFLIGIARLLGDAFAWLYYREYSIAVSVMGTTVFYLNLAYIVILYFLEKENRNAN